MKIRRDHRVEPLCRAVKCNPCLLEIEEQRWRSWGTSLVADLPLAMISLSGEGGAGAAEPPCRAPCKAASWAGQEGPW